MTSGRSILTQQVIEHEVYGRIVVTQEEMRKYYDEHTSEFDKPAGVRIAEVTVSGRPPPSRPGCNPAEEN